MKLVYFQFLHDFNNQSLSGLIYKIIKNVLLLLVLPIILLASCTKQDGDAVEMNNNDITHIQSGIMDFNKTTTIGRAMDNWTECGTNAWHSFKTSSGVRVVQFDCGSPAIVDLMRKFQDATDCDRDAMKCLDTNVLGYRTVIQWTMNIDGSNSFQVANAVTIIRWRDGRTFYESDSPLEVLQRAYSKQGKRDGLKYLGNVDPNDSYLTVLRIYLTKSYANSSNGQNSPLLLPANGEFDPHSDISDLADVNNQISSTSKAEPKDFDDFDAYAKAPESSFDCNSKAKSMSQLLICTDTELFKLDTELVRLYREAKSKVSDVDGFEKQANEARKWMELNCQDKRCLFDWYAERKMALQKAI